MNEQLVEQIQQVRFTPTRLREGYTQGAVDSFLEELAGQVAAGGPVRELVARCLFPPTRGAGYAMGEVDAFLDLVVARSEAAESSSATGSSSPGGALPPLPGGVVQEQRGLLGRLFKR